MLGTADEMGGAKQIFHCRVYLKNDGKKHERQLRRQIRIKGGVLEKAGGPSRLTL